MSSRDSLSRALRMKRKPPRRGHGLYYDPLYGYVPTSANVRQLVDLEPFQRLRGVKQLSTLYLVFSGATHTRFEHSIGVSHLARLAHDQLRDRHEDMTIRGAKRPLLNGASGLALEIGALLHDIGHGPFGHVFEMYCKRNSHFKGWNHEVHGAELITGQDKAGNKIDNDYYQLIPNLLRALHTRAKLESDDRLSPKLLLPENIAAIAFGDSFQDPELERNYHFLVQVVPALFGVDRLDYLRRDSYYTGTNTGGIDIWGIIRSLHLAKTGGDRRLRLYLPPAALPAVENLIVVRDYVYRNMYHNPVHRSAQELLIRSMLSLDANPASICLDNDSDLLARLASTGSGLTLEGETRLRYRRLYDAIPLGHHSVFGDSPVIKPYTEEERGWLNLKEKEQNIVTKLNIPANQTVMYDLEVVPAIRADDLTEEIFFDPHTGSSNSVLDLSLRLRNLYTGNNADVEQMARRYNLDSSMIYAYIPPDTVLESLRPVADYTGRAQITQGINRVYNQCVVPLVSGFLDDIVGTELDNAVAEEVKKKTRQYVELWFRDLLDYWKTA